MCNYVKGYRAQKTWHDLQVGLYMSAGNNERHITNVREKMVRFEVKK